MLILYGANGLYRNVTEKFSTKDIIILPGCDNYRFRELGVDPVPRVVKHILMVDDYANNIIFPDTSTICIERDEDGKFNGLKSVEITPEKFATLSPADKLLYLHSKLQMDGGNFHEEYPEQLMAAQYITPDDRVLELGANIGRNSCIIGSILADSKQLTAVECSDEYAKELCANRDKNKLEFNVEVAALSKIPLIQRFWNTMPLPSDGKKPEGWETVKTISWDALQVKYGSFNVLVADCEGALYYILKDEPSMLTGFNKIIIENDFSNIEHKKFVDAEFERNGFKNVYRKNGGSRLAYSKFPDCYDFFYEVWVKDDNQKEE